MTWVLLKRDRVDADPGKPSFHGHVIVATFGRRGEAKRWHALDERETRLVEVDDDMGRRINATLQSHAG